MIITFNSKSICICSFLYYGYYCTDKSKHKEPTFVLMYLEKLRGRQPTILWKGKFVNPHSSGSCFYYILKCLII